MENLAFITIFCVWMILVYISENKEYTKKYCSFLLFTLVLSLLYGKYPILIGLFVHIVKLFINDLKKYLINRKIKEENKWTMKELIK